MRDETIKRMHEANLGREMLLLRQFEFLNTRQLAYEEVLSSRMAILRAIWNPGWLKSRVDLKQSQLLEECRRAMEAAKAVKVVPKIIRPSLVNVSQSNGN